MTFVRWLILNLMELRKKWDIGGILVSIGCVFHCVLLPYFFTGLSILGFNVLHNIYIELALILTAGLFGVLSLYKSVRVHREHRIIVIFSIGFLLLFSKFLVVNQNSETIISIIALPCIILAHTWNLILQRRCNLLNCCNQAP